MAGAHNPRGLPIADDLSTGAILYFFKDGKPHIVLLTQDAGYYNKKTNDVDIGPSGGIQGEDQLASAAREIREETGLEAEIDANFCEDVHYEFDAIARAGPLKGKEAHIRKTRRYYVARISEADLKRIKLSPEHLGWSAPSIEEALNYPELKEGQKELLRKFQKYLAKVSLS